MFEDIEGINDLFIPLKFERVSYEQFKTDWIKAFPDYEGCDENVKDIYNDINLPTRSSTGSAGYDFKSPAYFSFEPGDVIKIPTGIRATMPDNLALFLYARSGIGSKHGIVPVCGTNVIDSDYAYSDNEGHIFMYLRNKGSNRFILEQGQGMFQGVFQRYYITDDDNVTAKRNGGFGSSDCKERKEIRQEQQLTMCI